MLSLTAVKDWLKITSNDNDLQLQELMDRAQAIIERSTGWYFGSPRAADEIFDGTGTLRMFLRQTPVSGQPIVVYMRPGATDAWEVVPTDDYEVEGRVLYTATGWLRGRRNFRATYQEGFTEPPGDVAQLFLEMVSSKWKDRGERTDMLSESIGDYGYTRADLISQPSWSTVQNNWRRVRL